MAELSQARQENISLLVTTQSWALSWVFSVHLFHPVNNNPRHPWISKFSILVLFIDSLRIKNIKKNFTYYHTWNSFEQMLPSCWWSWKKFRAILVCLWSWIELQCKCHCHHFFPPIFSDFGKNPQIVSFLENHCTMRRADGSLCSTMWVFSSHQCYKTRLVLSNILSWFIENES